MVELQNLYWLIMGHLYNNKYCKRHHPVMAKNIEASQTWQSMLKIREEAEPFIWWQVKTGNSSFWFDNWIGLRVLYYIEGDLERKRRWDTDALRDTILEEMYHFIMDNIKPTMREGLDKPCRTASNTSVFTSKSAYQLVRPKKEKIEWYKFIWARRLLNKVSFFLWRVLKGRIPTNDHLKRCRIPTVSKCYCWNIGCEETINQLFLTTPIVQKFWKQFLCCAGFKVESYQLFSFMI